MTGLKGKNILFFTGSLELGGSERQMLHVAKHLAIKEQAHVQVWGFSGPGRLSALCEKHTLPWRIIPNPQVGTRVQRFIKTIRLILAMRQVRPDILLPYTAVPNIVCALLWRWTNARLCIWNQRDSGIERFALALEKKAVSRIPLFISNSQQGAAFLEQTFHIPLNKIKVIRNGVEVPAPEKSRHAWRSLVGADEKTFLACMVANISRHKDHMTLLTAWRKVVDCLTGAGSHCILLLAGRFDDMEAPVKALAVDLDLGTHIRFLGGIDDIFGLLSAVDLGVLSSRAEGSPNGVLECMAAGLAVAGTDIPGTREVLCREGAAYLAAAEDSDGLAGKIIELALNPDLRNELGKKNRKRIAAEFTVERMCKETASLLSAWS